MRKRTTGHSLCQWESSSEKVVFSCDNFFFVELIFWKETTFKPVNSGLHVIVFLNVDIDQKLAAQSLKVD